MTETEKKLIELLLEVIERQEQRLQRLEGKRVDQIPDPIFPLETFTGRPIKHACDCTFYN